MLRTFLYNLVLNTNSEYMKKDIPSADCIILGAYETTLRIYLHELVIKTDNGFM